MEMSTLLHQLRQKMLMSGNCFNEARETGLYLEGQFSIVEDLKLLSVISGCSRGGVIPKSLRTIIVVPSTVTELIGPDERIRV